MTMLFVVLLAGCALLHNAFALRCFECIPGILGPCTDTQKDCPSGTQCGAVGVAVYTGAQGPIVINGKTCSPPTDCATGSLNLGITRTVINNKCCTQDLCNSGKTSVSTSNSPNGKQCYTCIGENCGGTLNCLADEDSCVSTISEIEGKRITLKGCASKSVCSSSTSVDLPGMSFKLNCCEGNLCNNVQGMGFSPILLMAAMLSITLFQ